MALFEAVVIFVVGFVSGTVVRWVAAFVALAVLGVTTPEIGLINQILDRYYLGNELLFVSAFLFSIDAERTKEVVVERRESDD
jgi:Na+/citrate or Na+/malate symporter